jgi:hypothetical protein
VSDRSEIIKAWTGRIRVFSYVSGLAGVLMMLVARTSLEPDRTAWSQRSFVFLGVMFAGFVAYYILCALRVYRK